jgi:hypothetical protein
MGIGRKVRQLICEFFPRKRKAQAVRSLATVEIHCFGGAATGTAGKGEDQRTILASLNLIV